MSDETEIDKNNPDLMKLKTKYRTENQKQCCGQMDHLKLEFENFKHKQSMEHIYASETT